MRPTRPSIRFFRRSAMDPSVLAVRFLVPLLLTLALAVPGSLVASPCMDSERRALLRLKSRFGDPKGRFSSWTGPDCCSWSGVTCDNTTGAILKLDLQHVETIDDQGYPVDVNGKLTGELDPSLLELRSLVYLDLSDNDLDDRPIPSWLGSLSRLQYLSLSAAGFAGAVPPQLGNLSSLQHLDISSTIDGVHHRLHFESFSWVSRLSSLRSLSLYWIDLSNLDSAEIIQSLNDNLPSLTDLQLNYCNLSGLPSSVSSLHFTSLTSLDLSYNDIGPAIPPWIFDVRSLANLRLEGCGFQGHLPDGLSQLSNLNNLFLSFNKFRGSLPASIGKLCKLTLLYVGGNNLDSVLPRTLDSAEDFRIGQGPRGTTSSSCKPLASLRELDVSDNKIPGHLPPWLEDLRNLMYLDVQSNLFIGGLPVGVARLPNMMNIYASNNRLMGEITEDHLSGMKNLINLDISNNWGIRVNVSPEWVPPFQIEQLSLSGCRVGPRFPRWIRNQEHLQELYLSDGGISDDVPSWFWGISPNLQILDLSSNLIEGAISEKISAWTSLYSLNISNNRFSGSIPSNLASMQLKHLDLSNNNLSGQVPLPDFFNASTLHGNPLLCGPPMTVDCRRGQEENDPPTRLSGAKRNPSFYLGMAVGAAAAIMITLAMGGYLGRSLLRKKNEEKMIPVYVEDPRKDNGRLGE